MLNASPWNILAQAFAGITTGFLVSPLNALIDKSIVLYVNGKKPLVQSATKQMMKLIKTPRTFFSTFEFRWTFFVYAMTYSTSNLADCVNWSDQISHPLQKLLTVFAVNTTCGILKDKALIQHFGLTKPKPFPLMALAFLFTRDIVAMSSAFTLPTMLAHYLRNKFYLASQNAIYTSQLICPLAILLFTCSAHLIGMDIYNRQKLSLFSRLPHIKGVYWQALMILIVRFLPAYGFGGIFNLKFRQILKKHRTPGKDGY